MHALKICITLFAVLFATACKDDKSGEGSDSKLLPELSGQISVTPTENVVVGMELAASYGGSEAVTLQWLKDGAALSGAQGNRHTPTSAGSYTAEARAEGFNSKRSNAVAVAGLIRTAEELNDIRQNLSAHYRLAADISLNAYANWEPIGTQAAPFTGKLDGMGYKIADLSIHKEAASNVGLLGYAKGAQLSNISLENVDVTGQAWAGGLAGNAEDSEIINCSAMGQVAAAEEYAGGLVGVMLGGKISNSHSAGRVTVASGSAGGLVGFMKSSQITHSHSAAAPSATEDAGGLVGNAHDGNTITNSYSTGEVTTMDGSAGGIAGSLSNKSSVTNSYSTGEVKATEGGDAGGIVGRLSGSTLSNSYSTGKVSAPQGDAGGIAGSVSSYGKEANSTLTGGVAINPFVSATGRSGRMVGKIDGTANTVQDNFAWESVALGASGQEQAEWREKASSPELVEKLYASLLNGLTSEQLDKEKADIEQQMKLPPTDLAKYKALELIDKERKSRPEAFLLRVRDDRERETIRGEYLSKSTPELEAELKKCFIKCTFESCGTTELHTTPPVESNQGTDSELQMRIGALQAELAQRGIPLITQEIVKVESLLEEAKKAGQLFGNSTENGLAKREVELKMQSTYAAPPPDGLGWDFTSAWKMPAGGGYPLLLWQ